MESVELRPLSLGELLDRTFTLYRQHFWLFVGIMAVPSCFAIPFNFFVFSKQSAMAGPAFGVNPGVPPSIAQFTQIADIVLAILAFLIIFWTAYSLAMGAATYAVSQAYLGEKATVRVAYRTVGGKFWRLLGVTINIMLRIVGLLILIFGIAGGVVFAVSFYATAPGGLGSGARVAAAIIFALLILAVYAGGIALTVYMALRYSVSIPALMIENLGVLESVRRSVRLTKGRRGQIFVAVLLAALIGYAGAIVFQLPFVIPIFISMVHNNPPPAWLLFTGSVSGAIGGAVTGPILMIVLVLCYYDARIRKEAFDLQFMMSSLEKPATATETVSPA